MTKPPWDCYSAKQREDFERWTNEQLDKVTMQDKLDQLGKSKTFSVMTERFNKMKRILTAIEAEDRKALKQLLDTEGWVKFYFDAISRRKKRGRPARAASAKERAAQEKILIQIIWQRDYGRVNRTRLPTALQIAARRNGLTPAQLANHLKKKKRERARALPPRVFHKSNDH
jgi:hypothetical protein